MNDELLQQLKETELEMLKVFSRICEENNLEYYLIGGSCLGAVRHNGFIPWDDDIDIGMPRKDYLEFEKIAEKELGNDFFFQNYHTDPECGLIFAKIRKNGTIMSERYNSNVKMHKGVWIDIFPYDIVPDGDVKLKFRFWIIQIIRNLYIVRCGYSLPGHHAGIVNTIYWLFQRLIKIIPIRFFVLLLDKLMLKEQYQYNNKNRLLFGGGYGLKDLMPKTLFDEKILTKFEDAQFYIYKDYDLYLTKLYGNYMELPPEEKRVAGLHEIVKIKL